MILNSNLQINNQYFGIKFLLGQLGILLFSVFVNGPTVLVDRSKKVFGSNSISITKSPPPLQVNLSFQTGIYLWLLGDDNNSIDVDLYFGWNLFFV